MHLLYIFINIEKICNRLDCVMRIKCVLHERNNFLNIIYYTEMILSFVFFFL